MAGRGTPPTPQTVAVRESLPFSPTELALWFQEAVEAEVKSLEQAGGTQRFELLSGSQVQARSAGEGVYQFILADGTRLPEDAEGRLLVHGIEFRASILGQEANRVQLLVEGEAPLPPGIPNATLAVDDTALLVALAKRLGELSTADEVPSQFASLPFHPSLANVGSRALPEVPALVSLNRELRDVLEQATGSSLTYVWGPPGTGKTYAIARLVTALVHSGERVLLTSHTHAAIDQALFETVSEEASISGGPMANDPLVREGKVLRLGRVSDRKVPEEVCLDKVVERESRGLQDAITDLEAQARPFAERRSLAKAELRQWQHLDELEQQLARFGDEERNVGVTELEVAKRLEDIGAVQAKTAEELTEARSAWFGRARKVSRMNQAITRLNAELDSASDARATLLARRKDLSSLMESVEAALKPARATSEGLRPRSELDQESARLDSKLADIEAALQRHQEELSRIEAELIDQAQVICCTLTKNYMGRELADQTFDAVIVDEVSMALPPLLFLAANRARARVIPVGDFLQLPPVVRSDTDVSERRLRQDAFHLSGVAVGTAPAKGVTALAKLTTQQRMVPAIADVARHLAYGPSGIEDDASVIGRESPDWLDPFPSSALVIVDTSDLHCWSGKQPGSLSRFNLYSATLAVELAALAAAGCPEPGLSEPPHIGIVTPYAAQRRLLARLVRDLELTQWVLAGTVHTFQGSEANLILFDAVLDDPYWSAMLCTPSRAEDVIRQLNVAVTRAKDKFVLIGSSDWLNKHAKPASGLGRLWQFLVDRAELVPAADLIRVESVASATQLLHEPVGWALPMADGVPIHEILDEQTFFPRFADDMNAASRSFFGLVPFFGQYRWPRVQPLFASALQRGVEVTLVVPPLLEASNRAYVEAAVDNLRELGAIVVQGAGLHGKDIVLDERIHYTGSLNWASHRGRSEVMHRTQSEALAKLVLQFLQARYIRSAATQELGLPRSCPVCGGPTQVVNQRKQNGNWDKQAMKVGCANPACQQYLRNIDERPPLLSPPVCRKDGRTKMRRVKRGRGEVWKCPKHPKECGTEKVVPGDPER